MSKDKMTEINIGITPTPWVAGGSFPYKGNEGYIFAVTNRPEILVCKTFGSIDENTPPIGEQMENSKAIVSAVNNTYGAGIDPEAVRDLLKELQDLQGRCERARVILQETTSASGGNWGILDTSAAKAAIEKAKL